MKRPVAKPASKYSWTALKRLLRYKLVIPMHRSPHPPEYTARGVGIGIFWALTPLIPGQMYLVFMTWLALRWSKRTDFNVLIALAWVWTTNVFTMGPVYYTFYVTGEILLGRWSGMTGYGAFSGEWETAFAQADGFIEMTMAALKLIMEAYGLPMLLGCLPWAIGLGVLGYIWSLRLMVRRQEVRRQRFEDARAVPEANGAE